MTDLWECQVFYFGHIRYMCMFYSTLLFLLWFFWGRECLRYWSVVGSWCGNLLTIYIREQEGGVGFFPYSIHWLMTAPRHARGYYNRRWICTAKTAYQQYICSFKFGKKIRTYFVCTPEVWIGSDCNVQHVLIAMSDD